MVPGAMGYTTEHNRKAPLHNSLVLGTPLGWWENVSRPTWGAAKAVKGGLSQAHVPGCRDYVRPCEAAMTVTKAQEAFGF